MHAKSACSSSIRSQMWRILLTDLAFISSSQRTGSSRICCPGSALSLEGWNTPLVLSIKHQGVPFSEMAWPLAPISTPTFHHWFGCPTLNPVKRSSISLLPPWLSGYYWPCHSASLPIHPRIQYSCATLAVALSAPGSPQSSQLHRHSM